MGGWILASNLLVTTERTLCVRVTLQRHDQVGSRLIEISTHTVSRSATDSLDPPTLIVHGSVRDTSPIRRRDVVPEHCVGRLGQPNWHNFK